MRGALAVVSLGAGLAWAGACDRSAPMTASARPPTVAGDTGDAATVEAETFVHASATAASADEAYAAAVESLAGAVLGDASWLRFKPITIHDRASDPMAIEKVSAGQFEAIVGLTRARTAAVISAFEVTDPHIEAPKAWHDALYAFVYAQAAVVVCQRRQALFEGACEPAETADAEAGLSQLATGLALVPAYAGGVPLAADGRPLRQPAVYAMWHGVPAKGVPLVVSSPDPTATPADPERSEGRTDRPVRTDDQGRATFEVPDAAWDKPLRISVDTASLLGPLQEAWPATEVQLVGRPTDLRRWGMLVTSGNKRLDDDAPFVKTLVASMRRRGLGDPVAIDAAATKRVLGTPAPKRGGAVKVLADALGGRLDVLLVIDVRSEFANRMGGSRVWFEARAAVDAHDAWTGSVLARLDVAETASGVGDDRADAAARRKTAETVVEQVLQNEQIPRPALPDAGKNAWVPDEGLPSSRIAQRAGHASQ